MLDTKSDTTAMTVMMMDTEIQQNRNRISKLEELLYIELPEKKLKLEQEKDENRRSQLIQQQRISAAELELPEISSRQRSRHRKTKNGYFAVRAQVGDFVTENRMELARARSGYERVEMSGAQAGAGS